MENWEKKLRDELDSRVSEPCCEKHVQHHHKKKSKGITDILCISLLLITSLNVFLIYQRYYSQRGISKPIIVADNGQALVKPIEDEIVDLKAKVVQITQRQDSQGEKVWILAIANNENANWLKQLDLNNAGKYLVLDHDWKLNKAPETLSVSEEDQKVLKKYLVP
jgi:hypothetical protein